MKKRRRRSGRFITLILICAALWAFGTFTLNTTDETISDPRINGDVRIVVLSDLHGASFGEQNERLIRRIEKAEPDLIVSVGDMYSAGDRKGQVTAQNLLSKLAEKYDVYYVNGEHDGGESFLDKISDAGVTVMNYRDEIVEYNGTALHIYGIDNEYFSPTFDLRNEFEPDEENYTVLLAHIPYYKPFVDFGIDLSICGDTHGGQVRLPGIGAIYSQGVWFPELIGFSEASLVKGLYSVDASHLFVTSGLGNYPFPIRLFNRPEVAVITLTAK